MTHICSYFIHYFSINLNPEKMNAIRKISTLFLALIVMFFSCTKEEEEDTKKDSTLKLKSTNTSSDYEVTLGSEKTLNTYLDNPNEFSVTYTLKEAIDGVSVSGGKLTVSSSTQSGSKPIVTASHAETSEFKAGSVDITFTVVETANKKNSTLRLKTSITESDLYLNVGSTKDLSAYFDIPDGVTMSYKLKADKTGVSISGSTLSIATSATEQGPTDGTFTIVASHPENSEFKAAELEKDFTIRYAFNITAKSGITVNIPTGSTSTKKDLFELFNNVTDATLGITFALKNAVTGVSIDETNKELVVSKDASAGDVVVTLTEAETSTSSHAVQGGTVDATVKLVVSSGTLTSGQIKISQTWSQETSDYDRTAEVFVPSGGSASTKYPVLLVIHGSGGNAESTLMPYKASSPDVTGYIVVAPQGYDSEKKDPNRPSGTWNLGKQNSKAPDISFIKELIEKLKTYDNVNTDNFTVLGRSNGGALATQLAIELPESYLQNIIAVVTNLNESQYHDDKFWGIDESKLTEDNPFTVEKTPAPRNNVMIVNGEKDGAIPYDGGPGIVSTQFLSTEESIFLMAKAMIGYTGNKLNTTDVTSAEFSGKNTGTVKKVSYSDGKAVMYNFVEGDHAFGSKTYTDLSAAANGVTYNFLKENKK